MNFVGKSALRGSTSLCSIALLAGFAIASPAVAQVTAAADAAVACDDLDANGVCDADEAGESEALVVTGSRIARPNLESTVPITSIAGESFIQQGNASVGDTLNELPQLRSTRGQQNAATGIGISGLNLLDLRGLGTNRTLVLVNGRRHVAGDITSTAQSPDVNTIPNDLIERVDIVTGGNSAIYGSDAIAGVVNFVLKRNFEGFAIRGNAGISTPGNYGPNYYISAMAGQNFDDGRGNITLHGEYAHQDRILSSDVPYLKVVEGIGIVDSDPGGLTNGSDGVFDNGYFYDIRSRSISRYGLIFLPQTNANPACGRGVGTTATNGVPYNCLLQFDANGNLFVPTEGTRYSTGPIGGSAGGGTLDTGREDDRYSIIPTQDRYNANLLAHYEFSPLLELFVEGKYVRVESDGSAIGYAGVQGALNQFDFRERFRLDNPYLTPAQRTTIAAAIIASGCNSSVNLGCGASTATGGALSAAQIAAVNAGTYRFALGRALIDATPRDESFKRETLRFVTGLRGTFNTDWGYELSANFGRMEEETVTRGFVDIQRLMLSLDAGLNPATGTIQCRSQFDPASAQAFDQGQFTAGGTPRTNTDQPGRLAADIAACVPFNPFGNANNSAAQAYFGRPSFNSGFTKQMVLSGFVNGDTSGFFNFWGGPARFALGAEYRKEDVYLKQDNFAGTAQNTNNVTLGPSGVYIDEDPFEVKEAFVELQLPIISDGFIDELTISGAARIAKYNAVKDPVYAYNLGIDFKPIEDVHFRANYSRAVRAPYISETGGSNVANFSPGFQDPCQLSNIGNNPNRTANCNAAIGSGQARTGSYSLGIISGPNPNLSPETSDSWTVGAVFRPRWIPGLSVTVDYYDIDVQNIIAAPAPQTIVNSCYDQPSLDNVFCDSFERFAGPGIGPKGELPGYILEDSLLSSPLNYASLRRRGIDTQIDYRTNLTENVGLRLFGIWTHNLQISNYTSPADPTFENRILGELGDPWDEFRIDTDLTFGAFTIGHSLRYVGKMYVGTAENWETVNATPPTQLDLTPIKYYPAIVYNNLRLEWDVDGDDAAEGNFGRDFNFYIGADNIFNEIPPLGASGAGAGGGGGAADAPGSANTTGAIYEVRGRQIFAGFRASF